MNAGPPSIGGNWLVAGEIDTPLPLARIGDRWRAMDRLETILHTFFISLSSPSLFNGFSLTSVSYLQAILTT